MYDWIAFDPSTEVKSNTVDPSTIKDMCIPEELVETSQSQATIVRLGICEVHRRMGL